MFFALNAALLDAGVATWEAKFFYDFVRPQSAIRDLYYDETVSAWAGPNQGTQDIDGQAWQPYQDTTFVTPPFPEYTSGHSSFSTAAANTIAAYVGSDVFYDGTTLSNYDLDDVAGTDLVGQYVATDLAFEDFTGAPVTLQWETLSEAAAEAGVSRIFGGIHIQDGDLNGRQIGEDVAALAQTKWDALFTHGGDDAIDGTASDDVIIAGAGADTVAAGDGSDTITGGSGADEMTGGAGADLFRDSLEDIFGDTITDFEGGLDAIQIDGTALARSALSQREGSAILGVDADSSGSVEADEEFTLAGTFEGGDFMAVIQDSNTRISFEDFLPRLQDQQAVDAANLNGVLNGSFFEGTGSRDYQITLRDLAGADFDNVLGSYEVTTAGSISNVQVLFSSTAAAGQQIVVQDVTDGSQLGFFLVQDGADWAASLAGADALSFVAADTGGMALAVNGTASQETVFLSHDASLNADGQTHALSGVDAGGASISIGFEDQTAGGDRDFQDVVFRVETADSFIM